MTIKVWLLFLLLVLPLAFCYYDPSLSHELSPRSEFKQCRQSCQVEERSRPQRQFCEQRCEDVLREREREEERDRPETYGRCEQRCERQATGQQQQLCRKRCEEHRRGRNNVRDPEEKFQQCQQLCQIKEHEQGQGQQQQCQKQCRERYEEEQGQEGEDPRQRFEKCQEKCQREEYDKRQQQCQKQCRERYEQEQEREHHRQGGREEWGQDKPQREREEESEQSHKNNPYYFHSRRFQSKFRSEQGHLSVLERFTERSQLLRGIENYRIAMIVARPRTFVLPNHCDGDSALVVIRGNGTISLVRENKRESYNIEFGDAMALQAGTTVYLVNNNENENMEIVKLVQPVNNPGNFQEFFAGGTENPQSYYSAFSSNLLEQVLRVSRDQIERVFGEQQSGERQRGERQQQQQEGFIRRASQEQLRALSKHASSSKRKGGRNSNGPIGLKNQKPLYSNNNGKFFEANPQEFKQLQDMDVFVNLVDINQGSIMVPHYNSKATVMAMVVEGNGRFEMACPHMSSQRQQGGGEPEEEEMEQYENVGARISPGDVFIIPAGHPVAIVSSQNQNLRIVGFGVNAQNSQRNFLAGKDNLMNQVETEAKELAFNVAGKEADGIFNNQKQSHFVPQQGQREESSRSHPLASILGFGEIIRA